MSSYPTAKQQGYLLDLYDIALAQLIEFNAPTSWTRPDTSWRTPSVFETELATQDAVSQTIEHLQYLNWMIHRVSQRVNYHQIKSFKHLMTLEQLMGQRATFESTVEALQPIFNLPDTTALFLLLKRQLDALIPLASLPPIGQLPELQTVWLDEPKSGWSQLTIKDEAGACQRFRLSYLDDVPSLLLTELTQLLQHPRDGVLSFDAEGWEWKLILTTFTQYVIIETDDTSVLRFDLSLEVFAAQILRELETHWDAWLDWHCDLEFLPAEAKNAHLNSLNLQRLELRDALEKS